MIIEKFFNYINYFHFARIFNYSKNLDFDKLIDIGAHKGEFIKIFFNNKNISKFYLFEPQIIPFKILKKNFGSNKKIKFYNLALSNKISKKILYLSKLTSTSSLEKEQKNTFYSKLKRFIIFSNRKNEKKIIKTNTIDNIFSSNEIKNALLKIDTEGHELNVLKGSKKKLKFVKYIIIEHQFFNLYQNNSKKLVHKFLIKNNFVLIKKFTFPTMHYQDIIYKNRLIKN